MDHGNNADRVDRYLAWRTVNALESISAAMWGIYTLALVLWIFYCAQGLITALWPEGDK